MVKTYIYKTFPVYEMLRTIITNISGGFFFIGFIAIRSIICQVSGWLFSVADPATPLPVGSRG